MILSDFIKYGISVECVKKAIEEISFKDKYFWGNFRWGLYNNVFILFEYNRFYGNIVRQIAYVENDNIVMQDCSSGGIEEKIYSLLGSKIEHDRCLTQYDIEKIFKSQIEC